MTIDYQRLLDWPIPDARQDYDEPDCILYALGLGFGSDPLDPRHLRHVYERDLEAFPSMALVLAAGPRWASDRRALHRPGLSPRDDRNRHLEAGRTPGVPQSRSRLRGGCARPWLG